MNPRMSSLYSWLVKSSFQQEAESLVKLCAGNPLPIDRHLVNDVIQELTEGFISKMIIFQLTPKDILGIVAGSVRIGDNNPISSEVYGEAFRRQKDVRGEEVKVTYRLMLSDNPEIPSGMASGAVDGPERMVNLFISPNGHLLNEIDDFFVNNPKYMNKSYWRDGLSLSGRYDAFGKMIKGYLTEVLRHEEVHARDVLYPKSNNAKIYKVKEEGGKSLLEIAKDRGVNPQGLFISNISKLISDSRVGLPAGVAEATLKVIRATGPNAQESIEEALGIVFETIKDTKLPMGFELYVEDRAKSQVVTRNSDNLKALGKRLGVDPVRLFVVNYNELFARQFGDAPAPSYQHLFDVPKEVMDKYLSMSLPADIEVRVIPSYKELYSYDRSFYLLTREESKAHFEQIIFQLERATENMSKTDISKVSFEKMLTMSPVISDYLDAFKKQPVDEIIKTPIYGYTIAQLKDKRYSDFLNRMYAHWTSGFRDIVSEEEAVDSPPLSD